MTTDMDLFKTIALALSPYIKGDTYDLLAAATAVQEALPKEELAFTLNGYGQKVYADWPSLLRKVYEDPDIYRLATTSNSKIPAIKEARAKFGLGLKHAKEAVEQAFPNQWPTYSF